MISQIIFLFLVFAAVVFIFQSLFVSIYSPQRASARQLRKHLAALESGEKQVESEILLNKKVESLSPFWHWFESQAWVYNYTYKMELSGSKLLGHQFLLIAAVLSLITGLVTWFISFDIIFTFVCIGLTIFAMHVVLNRSINKRMDSIEQQFPEAMDVLKRGLQAGYAFTDSLKLVCEEMEGDLSDEFKEMFNQINFGNDVQTALRTFVKRVPSTSAIAFCSAVAIHKETGGNLAENVENLSKIIRQRFTFKRRVRTLSAEGRLSGWVLILTPFALFALLYISSPSYASMLVDTKEGINLIKWGAGGMVFGTWWINKLINIEV